MKLFNCEHGAIYSAPFNDKTKKIVNLKILENLGHNSIKTQCLTCNHIDTYAKDELESGKVYMCKHCGKNAIYECGVCRLSIIKITNKDKIPTAECKCLDCGRISNYLLDDIMTGNILRCKHCTGGVYVGKRIGKVEIAGIGRNSREEHVVKFKCLTCNQLAGIFTLESTIKALRSKKDISNAFKCSCTNKLQNISQKNTNKPTQKAELPKENDYYSNIRISTKHEGFAFAVCKNCGVEKQYSIKHIIDEEPCDICQHYELGFEIAHRNISEDEVNRLRLSDIGKKQIVKMQSRYRLDVSNLSLIPQEFNEARDNRRRYKPSIECKCNNCESELSYSIDDITANDVKYCKACEFKYLIGSIVGSEKLLSAQEILKIYTRDNVTYFKTKCQTCGVDMTVLKTEHQAKGAQRCPVCSFKSRSEAFDNVVGNIFGAIGVGKVDNYSRVGKYLVLNERYNSKDGKYIIKAQCVECGIIIERAYSEKEGFIAEYSDKGCYSCDKLLDGAKNFINNNNWVGYMKNCRIIEDTFMEDQIRKANVKCLLCGDVSKVPLTVFLYSDHCICEHCANKKVVIACTSCGRVHENDITLSKLYSSNGGKIICPVTRNEVYMSTLRIANEEKSKIDFLIKKCTELADVEPVGGASRLVRSKNKFYEGTDGNKYYTCYCKEHNKFMSLLEDEMRTYDHVYCSDTRMFGYL